LQKIFLFLEKSHGKRIIAVNKSDLLKEEAKRKISAYLQSRRYEFCIISTKTGEGIDELKNKLVENSGVIRIYTKQPGKKPDNDPVVLNPGTTVEELARKIFPVKLKIKEIRLTGPSSKFPNQVVGLKHVLKDKDIVEFHTG
jgi:ribosome-interacting GTPase 1